MVVLILVEFEPADNLFFGVRGGKGGSLCDIVVDGKEVPVLSDENFQTAFGCCDCFFRFWHNACSICFVLKWRWKPFQSPYTYSVVFILKACI